MSQASAQSAICTEDDYYNLPENSAHDYIRKLNLYANTRVREYWIVNPHREHILLYDLNRINSM